MGIAYRIDAIVEMNKSRVAVGVDGPSNFTGRKPKGSRILKCRQIASLDNLRDVSVPYWEWIKLKKKTATKSRIICVSYWGLVD